mmetsp:Transcript_7022/g.12630  ORF Transcript_7022/g.12630 Transcript_7022/m.12630 type:complete len:403 (-) Transcript_7022:94-1302(-)|eukprot:CAMPEP_0182512548 /NCGR_PEP_ID=MMETSP1321-20130603/32331_1 /TAXON_ID=91990 /ORGANISM="Bolidomonas sp., Strain RCC1657" /LENGTH=402 /DNA_ID=CAMNT_0024719395 /DNA_START=635 /DNA_END=1843 /DNA_ORIENTATION=-
MFSSANPNANSANLDIDLQDIFSDYFLEEFNNSAPSAPSPPLPFNNGFPAPTAPGGTVSPLMMDGGLMGNPNPQPAAPPNLPPSSNLPRSKGISLPTGKGITTSWHTGALPSIRAPPSGPSPHRSMPPPPTRPPHSYPVAPPLGAPSSKRKYSDDDDDTAESAVAERRLRNREHAKRSRVRKKFMLESLQEEVRLLQGENSQLRLKIQRCLPTKAQQIFQECCSSSELFDDGSNPAAAGAASTGKLQTKEGAKEEGNRSKSTLDHSDYNLISSLTTGQQNFCLSDPRLPDNPIVFASEGFYSLTGYTPQQVLGRNCRFLQGPGTDPTAVDVVRRAIENGTDATVCLLNYRADGTPFWNQFFVAALRDEHNEIVNYVGVQCPVEPVNAQEILERKVNEVLPLK